MAGKHVGGANFVADLSHPCPSPYRKENRAFADGANGLAAPGDTVGAAAHALGAANPGYETGLPSIFNYSRAQIGSEAVGAVDWTDNGVNFGNAGGQNHLGLRFDNVVFPNAAVTSAILSLTWQPYLLGTAATGDIFLDTDVTHQAGAWSDVVQYPSIMDRTTAFTAFTAAGNSTQQFDITAAFNETRAIRAGTTQSLLIALISDAPSNEFVQVLLGGASALVVTP